MPDLEVPAGPPPPGKPRAQAHPEPPLARRVSRALRPGKPRPLRAQNSASHLAYTRRRPAARPRVSTVADNIGAPRATGHFRWHLWRRSTKDASPRAPGARPEDVPPRGEDPRFAASAHNPGAALRYRGAP